MSCKKLQFLTFNLIIFRRCNFVYYNWENTSFYLYYLLCSDSYRGHVLGTATGSTVKHTAPDRIKDFSFILSESDILNQFEKIAASIIHQTVNLESKNINLRKTRDLLLPRLISGEIDVENLAINTGI